MGCIIAGAVVMYIYYTKGTGCGLNVFFITFNLILCIVMMIGSVLPRVQEVRPRAPKRTTAHTAPAPLSIFPLTPGLFRASPFG